MAGSRLRFMHVLALLVLQITLMCKGYIRDSNENGPVGLASKQNYLIQRQIDDNGRSRNQHGTSESTQHKAHIGLKNLKSSPQYELRNTSFIPGQEAPQFILQTLQGPLVYPGPIINKTTAILFHAFYYDSGFIQALWNSQESLEALLMNTPDKTHYVFLSSSKNAVVDAKFMYQRLKAASYSLSPSQRESIFSRMHFVTSSLSNLHNWITEVFQSWTCQDHNCGIDQVHVTIPAWLPVTSCIFITGVVSSKDVEYRWNLSITDTVERPLNTTDVSPEVIKLPRLDARYDWLPSPTSVFGNKSVALTFAGDGCSKVTNVTGSIALALNGKCSYFQKIVSMQDSGAKGVLIMVDGPIQDMVCQAKECDVGIKIPASMITYNIPLSLAKKMTVTFSTKPWNNFFLAIDGGGKLAEVGWFLYPSFQFFIWQAQWFEYFKQLEHHLREASSVISIFQRKVMQGKDGVVSTIEMPPLNVLQTYKRVELDMSLSCPGTNDESCPHWDHTIQLFVCCNNSSLCGMELGRWISSFRRRIGRWVTDITPLLPLLSGSKCTFTMKTVPWALPWVPSLNIRLIRPQFKGPVPSDVTPLFTVGATFDKSYNSHWKPITTRIPTDAKKVYLVAVITGHGSDNNGCGEFCVTSHHFTVNGGMTNITFSNAGTPLGCADRVLQGVEPNEHGTWLYGRDGWCDGQQVDPIVRDVTHMTTPGGMVVITYRGTFNGTDPNPTRSPGLITIYSYLSVYR